MKKQYLLFPALFLMLTAECAGFDQATLDKKLTELAASPVPDERATAEATEAVMTTLTLPQTGEFICPLCGEPTRYSDSAGFADAVSARTEARDLAELGLEVAADVREFCQKCTPYSDNFYRVNLPVKGILAQDENGLPAGTVMKLAVDRCGNVLAAAERWIYSPLIGRNGQLLKNAQVRSGPGKEYASVDVFLKGRDVYAETPLPGDPPDWTRLPTQVQYCNLENMRDLEYGIFFQADTAPEVWWDITIDGQTRRLKRQPNDAALLRAFLSGQCVYAAERGRQLSVRAALPRLRELIGAALPQLPEKKR